MPPIIVAIGQCRVPLWRGVDVLAVEQRSTTNTKQTRTQFLFLFGVDTCTSTMPPPTFPPQNILAPSQASTRAANVGHAVMHWDSSLQDVSYFMALQLALLGHPGCSQRGVELAGHGVINSVANYPYRCITSCPTFAV